LHNYLPFTVLTFVAVVIGGLIQLIPTVTVNRAKNIEDRLQKIYTPLELAGRDLYVSEGCYNCHSQMIRTMVPDVLRYGDYSRLGESIYDHPFQWGSKRTGPDLAREGKGPAKKSDSWHYKHLVDPRSMSPGSNMPPYAFLAEKTFDQKALPSKIAVMTRLGVPYPVMEATEIKLNALQQGAEIAKRLAEEGVAVTPDKQIVAVIAYLQKLGHYEVPEAAKPGPSAAGGALPADPWQPRQLPLGCGFQLTSYLRLMFYRVAYEHWHDVVPFIAFGTTALIFLTMSVRGLLLNKDKAEQMSHIPLDD